MRDYAKVTPLYWTGRTGKQLRGHPEAQIIGLYLLTCRNSSMIGLYYLPLPTLSHETGLTFEGCSKGLRRLSEVGFAYYDEDREEVFVPNMARIQIGELLKKGDKQVISVRKLASACRDSKYFRTFVVKYADAYNLGAELKELAERQGACDAPSMPLRSQEQEQEQEQDQEQDHPTGDELLDLPPPKQPATPGAAGAAQASFELEKPEAPKKSRAKVPPDVVAKAITHYGDRWLHYYRPEDGKRPILTSADRGQLVQQLAMLGFDEWRRLLELYFRDADPFLVKEGHALALLTRRVNGLRARRAPSGPRASERPGGADELVEQIRSNSRAWGDARPDFRSLEEKLR